MKTLYNIIAAVLLFLLGALAGYFMLKSQLSAPTPTQNCPAASAPADFNKYDNARYNLEISYPNQAKLITDKNQMAQSGYIPACDPTNAFACVLYTPKEIFSKTNFESAGLALNSYPDRNNETACLALANGEFELATKTINGIKYSAAKFGDAAAGHQSSGVNYRTFINGNCLEISTRINTSTFENYPLGAIEKFTEADRQLLENMLSDILNSLKFIK